MATIEQVKEAIREEYLTRNIEPASIDDIIRRVAAILEGKK